MLDSTHGHHHRPDVPPALLMFVVSLLFLSHPSDSASAQEEGGSQGYTAVTIADPKVPTDHLQLMLRSLTKDELIVEADAWLGLLKAKIKEITDAELQRKRSGGAEARVTTEGLVTLHNEQAALADRARTVLAELRNKGGDVQSYETYITAVSGLSAVSTDSDVLRTFVMSWLQSPEGGWPTRPSI